MSALKIKKVMADLTNSVYLLEKALASKDKETQKEEVWAAQLGVVTSQQALAKYIHLLRRQVKTEQLAREKAAREAAITALPQPIETSANTNAPRLCDIVGDVSEALENLKKAYASTDDRNRKNAHIRLAQALIATAMKEIPILSLSA